MTTLAWSGLVDQRKVDQFIGHNVIFDILDLPAFKSIASVGSFKHFVLVFVSVFVFVFVLKWTVGFTSQK